MTSCIYTIVNKINNKIYVGKTNHFCRRKNQHKRSLRNNTHGNDHLQRSWNKYGEENFEFEILESYPNEHIYSMENYWCNMLDSFNYDKGYNQKPTNPFNKGGNSLQAREKLRQANLGKKASPEAKRKMSLAKLGKTISIETRQKMSKALKGKIVSDETRKKQSINRYNNPLRSMLGKRHPDKLLKQIAEHRKRPILQYDLEMNFIKEWKSGVDAQNALGILRGNISSCCTLHRNEAGGFKWRRKN
jgi:group I intron endonuclease